MNCQSDDLALIKSNFLKETIKCYSEKEVARILSRKCTVLKDPITNETFDDAEYKQLYNYIVDVQKRKKVFYIYIRYTEIFDANKINDFTKTVTEISKKNFIEKLKREHFNDDHIAEILEEKHAEILEYYMFKCFQVLYSLNNKIKYERRIFFIKEYLDLAVLLIEEIFKIRGIEGTEGTRALGTNKKRRIREVPFDFEGDFVLGKLVFNLEKEEIVYIMNKFLSIPRMNVCIENVQPYLEKFAGYDFIAHSRTIENKIGQCGLNSFITIFSVFNIFGIEFEPVRDHSSLYKIIPPGYIEFYNLFIGSLKLAAAQGVETICIDLKLFINEMNKIPGYENRVVGGGLFINDIVNIFMKACNLLYENNHKIPGFVFYRKNDEIFRTVKRGFKESLILRVSDVIEESFKNKNLVSFSLHDTENAHAAAAIRDFYYSPDGNGFALNTYTVYNNEYTEYFSKFPEHMKNQHHFGIYLQSNFFN
jgi:hypothetical protein